AQESPFHVASDDPAVGTDWVSYTSTDGVGLAAYLAWPADAPSDKSLPGVAICHPNTGVSNHIQDVARRFAKQGYVAIAADLPSRSGRRSIDFTDPSELQTALRSLDSRQSARDFAVALDFLRGQVAVDEGKLAATGYCLG